MTDDLLIVVFLLIGLCVYPVLKLADRLSDEIARRRVKKEEESDEPESTESD